MPTSFPMSLPHAPTGFVNQAALDTAFTTPINDLAAIAGSGFLGESNTTTGGPTLSTLATDFATAAHVTFSLSGTRRVRIVAFADFLPASATAAAYICQAAYNTGGTANAATATKIGFAPRASTAVSGGTGSTSATSEGTVLLTAGTYTALGCVQRALGGNAADSAPLAYVGVYDIGSV